MALNNITFKLGQGGLGRPLPGEDHYSGFVFYTASLPSGFTSTSRMKQIFSITDAENAGIKSDYSDATAATGSYLVTAAGANGDTVELKVAEPFGVITSIGIYKKTATETSAALVAAAISAAINAGTNTHGYTATVNTATVTITAPKKFGIFLNSGTPLTATYSDSATLAGTITQFTGGVASKQAVWHYHIKRFFDIQPKGILYIGFFSVPGGSYTFTEAGSLQNFAGGKIRQWAVYKDGAAYASGDLTTIDTVNKSLVAAHKETIALYGADLSGTSDISTIADLSLLNANTVQDIISQDGGGLGAFLYVTYGKSITNLGAMLGATALAKVSESIAWVEKFNISDGTEDAVIAFANGVLHTDSSVSDNLLDALNNKRHVFLRKFVGQDGSYFNDNHMACSFQSDYAYQDDNRVIQKVTRGVYKSVLPALNSTITLNADGTLQDTDIAYLTGLAEVNIIQMERDKEISAHAVVIDPTQDINATSKLIIQVQIVKDGIARNIEVPVGYRKSI